MASIDPYRLHPRPPAVAVLTDLGEALEETGELHDLEHLPPGVRAYGSWDVVDRLLSAGVGEAFYWDGEPTRWRHRTYHEDYGGWTRRASDVTVFRIPFPEDDRKAIVGLADWRDWLAGYGAAPQGSLGSSAMSLLRATLADSLWTARGDLPPIRWTLGGRQELGTAVRSSHTGAHHLDLPAAYAQTLGELRYGGVWREVRPDQPERYAAAGAPVFAHATVAVPELRYGPLPRRMKVKPERASPFDLLDTSGALYPTADRLVGTWTWQELEEASSAGARVKLDRLWVHVTEAGELGQPFAPWWRAVQEGRALPGFGGLLAKTSANALWGQFAIGDGRRQLVRYVDGERQVVNLPVPGGGQPRSWDLAETITGRVRAMLHRMMRHADDRLLSVHTDGGWTSSSVSAPAGWRVKDEAARIDVLGPQMLRYWRPRRPEPLHCVAGVPARFAARTFQAIWEGGDL